MRKTLGLVLASLLAFALLPHAPALAATTYHMVFPVAGPHHYSDTFGAPRSGGRTHQGNDIMADKMTPIVAVADGTVGWMHDELGGNCCAMALNHDDGWVSWYIHMNNDTPGTDDGQGWGFAPGITTGVHVLAGQLIGWVGDSGNAENVAPHLHFELHMPDGTVIDPYYSLTAAEAGSVPRLAGTDRYETAAKVSLAGFPAGADEVFVAVGTDFADALSVAPLAASVPAPVLLVAPDSIPASTATELTRLSPTHITLVGGTGAISAAVESDLASLTGAPVDRIAGASRYETAALLSQAAFPGGSNLVFVAAGTTFPDALGGAAAAAKTGAPLLLVHNSTLPSATAAELNRLNPTKIIILGGEGVVSAAVEQSLGAYAPIVERVFGEDRYATAAALSKLVFPSGAARVYIASGLGFPDALAGASLAGQVGVPLLLVGESEVIPFATLQELHRLHPSLIIVVGGESAVNSTLSSALLGIQ